MTMQESIQELMAFLDYSVTSYHAVEMLQNTLRQEGFTALSEKKRWTLDKGGSYYVDRKSVV